METTAATAVEEALTSTSTRLSCGDLTRLELKTIHVEEAPLDRSVRTTGAAFTAESLTEEATPELIRKSWTLPALNRRISSIPSLKRKISLPTLEVKNSFNSRKISWERARIFPQFLRRNWFTMERATSCGGSTSGNCWPENIFELEDGSTMVVRPGGDDSNKEVFGDLKQNTL